MTWNWLLPIHREDARMRHEIARLGRDRWLTSKERRYLEHALHAQVAYRNLVGARFDHDERSPAQRLGCLPGV